MIGSGGGGGVGAGGGGAGGVGGGGGGCLSTPYFYRFSGRDLSLTT